jgi:uncharacterized protein YkuJ
MPDLYGIMNKYPEVKKTWDSHEVITTRFRKNGWDLYEVNVSTSEHPGKRLVL